MTLALVLGLAHSAMALLSKGNRGPAVTSLQLNLQNAGYDPGPIDGVFGGATEYAVRRFQSDRGLSIDGVVGPSTEAALTGATSTARRPQSNSSSQRTIELQQLLANRSCYQGPIDGIYGPATNAAVLRAQRVYGLVVDGIAGPATIAALQASRCNCS